MHVLGDPIEGHRLADDGLDAARIEDASAAPFALVARPLPRSAEQSPGELQHLARRRTDDVLEPQARPALREHLAAARGFVGVRREHARVDAAGRGPAKDVDGDVPTNRLRHDLEHVLDDADLVRAACGPTGKHEPHGRGRRRGCHLSNVPRRGRVRRERASRGLHASWPASCSRAASRVRRGSRCRARSQGERRCAPRRAAARSARAARAGRLRIRARCTTSSRASARRAAAARRPRAPRHAVRPRPRAERSGGRRRGRAGPLPASRAPAARRVRAAPAARRRARARAEARAGADRSAAKAARQRRAPGRPAARRGAAGSSRHSCPAVVIGHGARRSHLSFELPTEP